MEWAGLKQVGCRLNGLECTLLSTNHTHARQTEVSKLEMAFPIDEKIVWFEVAMDYTLCMQILDSGSNIVQ